MNSVAYLGSRVLYRLVDFLRHWYVGGFYFISHRALNLLALLDRRLALKVTLRYWLKPLYQDYTALGYILGFILRTGRIIVGSIVYAVALAAAAAAYVAWAAIPIYIIYLGL